jgi:hypothetical protein
MLDVALEPSEIRFPFMTVEFTGFLCVFWNNIAIKCGQFEARINDLPLFLWRYLNNEECLI